MTKPTRTRNFGRNSLRDKHIFTNGKSFIPGAKKLDTKMDGSGRVIEVWYLREKGVATYYAYEPAIRELHCVATADDKTSQLENITSNSSRSGVYGLMIGCIIRNGTGVKTLSDVSDGHSEGNQDAGTKQGRPKTKGRKGRPKTKGRKR